jgi:hypothetical protein
VESYDNFHYADGGDWMTNGEFDSADEALACAQGIIDAFLEKEYQPGISAKDLQRRFQTFGEVPCFRNEEGLAFEPYDYLARRIKELTGEEPPE